MWVFLTGLVCGGLVVSLQRARALQRPDLSRQDRRALYEQASVFAFRASRLAAEQGEGVQRQTDAAVRAAHLAALQIARAVENGIPQPDAAAQIAAAAGPGFAAIAGGQTHRLEQSLTAHPDQGRYRAQAGRALNGIPAAFFWIIAIALALVILAFPRLYVRLGRAGAVKVSLLVLLALPLSWVPLALLHALTFWPDGWVALVLWLGLFVTLFIAGPRLLPARLRRVWMALFSLCAALARSDFSLRDLKHRKMTVYLAIPPDRLRACLGFVRGFIGLALDAITATPGKPQHRVAFFLDEFGQLGRMDRLTDSITLLRGYGAQLWLFVQDLSQLRAVYPRWQGFMANTTRQFFGTADYDTARYISDALGQHTIRFETENRSWQTGHGLRPDSLSAGRGEHRSGRPLLTPDEVARLGQKSPSS